MLMVPVIAAMAIYDYYLGLPIEGAFDESTIAYPKIEKESLYERLAKESTETLENMRASGLQVVHWQSILDKVDATVISEVVPKNDPFFVREHYPYDEVFDDETLSLYYYHSHRPGEHGHFHLFYCDEEVLEKYTPLSTTGKCRSSVHLFAISIHPDGTPLSFFTTNHWITPKEWWYSSDTIQELVDQFEITHSYPSYPANQWITHMVRLFKPQIQDILAQRDITLKESELPLDKALKDKSMEILSQVPISIESQLEAIDEILATRRVSKGS